MCNSGSKANEVTASDLKFHDSFILSELLKEISRDRIRAKTNKNLLARFLKKSGDLSNAVIATDLKLISRNAGVVRKAIQTAAIALRFAAEGDSGYAHYEPGKAIQWIRAEFKH